MRVFEIMGDGRCSKTVQLCEGGGSVSGLYNNNMASAPYLYFLFFLMHVGN
jgi:hypothetical protein